MPLLESIALPLASAGLYSAARIFGESSISGGVAINVLSSVLERFPGWLRDRLPRRVNEPNHDLAAAFHAALHDTLWYACDGSPLRRFQNDAPAAWGAIHPHLRGGIEAWFRDLAAANADKGRAGNTPIVPLDDVFLKALLEERSTESAARSRLAALIGDDLQSRLQSADTDSAARDACAAFIAWLTGHLDAQLQIFFLEQMKPRDGRPSAAWVSYQFLLAQTVQERLASIAEDTHATREQVTVLAARLAGAATHDDYAEVPATAARMVERAQADDLAHCAARLNEIHRAVIETREGVTKLRGETRTMTAQLSEHLRTTRGRTAGLTAALALIAIGVWWQIARSQRQQEMTAGTTADLVEKIEAGNAGTVQKLDTSHQKLDSIAAEQKAMRELLARQQPQGAATPAAPTGATEPARDGAPTLPDAPTAEADVALAKEIEEQWLAAFALSTKLQFKEAIALIDAALAKTPAARLPQYWSQLTFDRAYARHQLGTAMTDTAQSYAMLESAALDYTEALRVFKELKATARFIPTLRSMCAALAAMAERSAGTQRREALAALVTGYKALVAMAGSSARGPIWVMTYRELAYAARDLALVTDDTTAKAELYEDAAQCARRSLALVEGEVAAFEGGAATVERQNCQRLLTYVLRQQSYLPGVKDAAAKLDESASMARAALQTLPRSAPNRLWDITQYELGLTLESRASMLEEQESARIYGEAAAAYTAARDTRTPVGQALPHAEAQLALARVLASQGNLTRGDAGVALLQQALKAAAAAEKIYAAAPDQQWSQGAAQYQKGFASRLLSGRATQPADAARMNGEAITAYEASMKLRPLKTHPADFALTSFSLAAALLDAGRAAKEDESIERITLAAATYHESAMGYRAAGKDYHNQAAQALVQRGWVLQNDLAPRADAAGKARHLEDAAQALGEALELFTSVRAPVKAADARRLIALVRQQQGRAATGEAAITLLSDAEDHCRAAITSYHDAAMQSEESVMQGLLASLLIDHAKMVTDAKAPALLSEAAAAALAAFDLQTGLKDDGEAADARELMGAALFSHGARVSGETGLPFLTQAAAAYEEAAALHTRAAAKDDTRRANAAYAHYMRAEILWSHALRLTAKDATPLFASAAAAYRSALPYYEQTKGEESVANRMRCGNGDALLNQALPLDDAAALPLLTEAATSLRACVDGNVKLGHRNYEAEARSKLGAVLLEQGRRTKGKEGRGLLTTAITELRAVLDNKEWVETPANLQTVQYNLGAVCYHLGSDLPGAEGVEMLTQSVTAYRAAADSYAAAGNIKQADTLLETVATLLSNSAAKQDATGRLQLLTLRVSLMRRALELHAATPQAREHAWSQQRLGAALSDLATASATADQPALLLESVAAFDAAMKGYTQPIDRGAAGFLKAATLLGLAMQHGTTADKITRSTEAAAAYGEAMKDYDEAKKPVARETARMYMAMSWHNQSVWGDVSLAGPLEEKALATYAEAAKTLTKEIEPNLWADIHDNTGRIRETQGDRASGAEAVKVWKQAEESFSRALEVRTAEQYPQEHTQLKARLERVRGKLAKQTPAVQAPTPADQQ